MTIITAFLARLPAWIYAGLAALVLLGLGGWWTYSAGQASTQAKWDAEKLRISQHKTEVVQQQVKVETKVVTEYVDRVKVVYKQAAAIIKEVPVYVTKIDDSRCTINGGFVSVWNAANAGVPLSGTPSSADAAPSGIVLSDVAAQHVDESTYTRGLEAQLTALQDWATGVAAVK